jgi:hypothetical protein
MLDPRLAMGEAELVPRVTKEDSPRERLQSADPKGNLTAEYCRVRGLSCRFRSLWMARKRKPQNRRPIFGIEFPLYPTPLLVLSSS